MTKTRQIIALIFNVIIVLLETIGLTIVFCNDGISSLQYFTVDSNIIAFISSLLYSICTIVDLVYEKDNVPGFVNILRYIASTFLFITITVVLTILGPTMGGYKAMLLDGAMLYHHILCPILAIVSYTFIEKQNFKGYKVAFLPFTLSLIYGIYMIVMNINGRIDGPYPFLKVRSNSIIESILYGIGILGATYLFGIALNFLNKKKDSKKVK